MLGLFFALRAAAAASRFRRDAGDCSRAHGSDRAGKTSRFRHGRGRTRCDPAVDDRLRVPVPVQNVMLPMRALGRLSPRQMEERADALLASLGLGEQATKRPDQLSGGQHQRVAVARALANEPPLILADEPTCSLDSKSSEQVFEILPGTGL